jgi:16S rRNA (cytosine1402-N4)-methyltransferase
LARFADRIRLVHAVYDELADVLDGEELDGALFDLGVSSLQLDDAARGFAYAKDAPLDMRMDQTRGATAAEVLNTYSAADLARILREYGEEKFASRIANAIVRERARAAFDSSARLAELVRDSIPAPARRTGGHPAKRTFQALRIEVNGELAALERALPAALDALRPGGRIVVLAYHSLEDRLVKRAFAERARSTAPVELPFEPEGSGPSLRLLTRGAELPGAAEVAANPRAASVRLRAAERIDRSRPRSDRPMGRPGRQQREASTRKNTSGEV